MLTCVISTVGQSVFTNAGKVISDAAKEFGRQTDVKLGDIVDLKKQDFPGASLHRQTLAVLKASSDPQNLHKASAELNSLDRILAGKSPNRNDRLDFLASETPDGALAARVIADFCKEYFEREAALHLIEGLQVSDGLRFRRVGLRSLINTLYDILKEVPAGTYTRILNTTGGFKGVVPYLTVIGMLEGVEVSYIYEQSPELLVLSGLPLRLDYDLLKDSYEALVKCRQEGQLSRQDLIGLLKLQDQRLSDHPTWALFEVIEVDGQDLYALNGLGEIVLRHLEKSVGKSQIYLSKQAAKRWDAMDNVQKQRFARIINQMADPVYREGDSHLHGRKGEAVIHKQPSEDERILYFEMKNGDVLIAELALHSDGSYDRLPDLRRKEYDTFRKWEP